MSEIEAQSLADQAVMLGLMTRVQAREAIADAADGSLDAVVRSFLRKGLLTSWQVERLKKGDPSGFFFGGCKVLFHLAEGTFARVYRGERCDDGSPVAIKVLRQRYDTDPAAIDLFNKEAEAGMKLRHPNIVQILDYGEQDKRHYMIMEYVEGSNLRDFLRIRSRVEPHNALPLMLGLARGLKYSLDREVTHRDIKGTNILISNSGEAKLVDFGLATIGGDDKKATMTSQRTVDYSALERTCGSEKGDPRSDIYFLGCVFYQMITGQLPMKEVESKDMLAKMLKRSFGAIVPLSEHRLAPDPELARVIEKMMTMDLKARYQTMDAVLADLEAYEERIKSGFLGVEAPTVDDDFLAELGDVFSGGAGAEAAPASASAGASAAPAAAVERRKVVLCVEARTEIQDAFRKTLSKMGYRVILLSDPERAAERFREKPSDAVIFDCDGLAPEAVESLIDMYDKAQEDEYPFAALVLLGTKQKELQERLPEDDRLVVLSKPVMMKQIQRIIRQLAPIQY